MGAPARKRVAVIAIASVSPPLSRASSPDSVQPSQPEFSKIMQLLDAGEYVHCERRSIEQKQVELDRRGHRVEMRLRMAMSQGNKAQEEELMQEWFQLVAQKNILIRQNEELSLLEQQYNLEKRYALVNRQLRRLVVIDENEKNSYDRHQEESLLKELTDIVAERNIVAQNIHEAELLAQREDEEVQRAIKDGKATAAPDDRNCVVM